MATRRAFTFRDGMALAVGVLALMALLYFAAAVDTWRQIYRDFGSDGLPALTRVVLSPTWRVVAPLAGAMALAYALLRRPAQLFTIAATASSLALVVIWVVGLYMPIGSLAGKVGS
jgi:hypothetical protein